MGIKKVYHKCKRSLFPDENDLLEKPTPMPTKRLTVALLCLGVEAFTITLLFPFVAFMVQDFGFTTDQTSFYAGIIASAFTFCQFCSSFFWGWISDRIGRRPVLLIGLAGNTACIVLFGFSKAFWQAVVTRGLNGLLNGNIGVIKTYVREISDNSNQSRCFSYFGVVWGAMLVFGPVAGGFLVEQPKEIKDRGSGFFEQNPYVIPCLLSGLVSFLGLLMGFFCLEESLSNPKPLFGKKNDITSSDLISDVEESNTSVAEVCSTDFQVEEDISTWQSFKNIMKGIGKKDVLITTMAYVVLSWVTMGVDELFGVWAKVSINEYGLSFTPHDIAICLSASGVILLFFQFFLWNILERKIGVLILFKVAMLFIVILCFMLPYSHEIARSVPNGVFWFIIITQYILRGVARVLTFTSIFVMGANAIVGDDNVGAINGFVTSAASLARSTAPIALGAILSWSADSGVDWIDFHFAFIILAVVGFLFAWIPIFFVDKNTIAIRRSDKKVEQVNENTTEKTPLLAH